MGGDALQQYHRGLGKNFYPHSRMGIDSWPMRCWITWRNFYPRSRMGSDQVCNPACGLQHISIHAPAWGATGEIFNACGDAGKFLSTLPHGERLRCVYPSLDVRIFLSTLPHGERQMALRGGFKTAQISIYAPAWGATECAGDGYGRYRHFYPRPPHGERLMMRNLHPSADEISIHAPAWGATRDRPDTHTTSHISIHALAWGATNIPQCAFPTLLFLSTPPRGERPSSQYAPTSPYTISIHAPRGERPASRSGGSSTGNFYPRPRVGSDGITAATGPQYGFLSTPPRGERPFRWGC